MVANVHCRRWRPMVEAAKRVQGTEGALDAGASDSGETEDVRPLNSKKLLKPACFTSGFFGVY